MKYAFVVGARPQFIKAAPLLREFKAAEGAEVTLIHTGQHFDDNMSTVFFRQLNLPEPDFNLGIHSGTHGGMTGRMLAAIEECLIKKPVDRVIVFGDTNSTLAGAIAATKLGIPCAHIEAGLRSWNRAMPEEINRVLVDHCSTWLFCPTEQAVKNLAREGIYDRVYLVGDIMFDAVRLFGRKAEESDATLARLGLAPSEFLVLTIHRPYNTEAPETVENILRACGALHDKVLFPVHPRTRPLLNHGLGLPPNVILSEPLGYMDMLSVVSRCKMVLTDSGGLQKEAYFLGVPCVTLRPETEWVETVSAGWNIVAGTETDKILEAVRFIGDASRQSIPSLGDGTSARQIARILHDARSASGSYTAAAAV